MDKYAVAAGGGHNHRLDLSVLVLLKENHSESAVGVTAAIGAIGRGMARTGQTVESGVEVRTVTLAVEALDAGARWIMLDNMTVAAIEQVVKLRPCGPTLPGSFWRPRGPSAWTQVAPSPGRASTSSRSGH
ncbi:hypothetical protein AB0D21_15320 [Streptomyces hundungensis]